MAVTGINYRFIMIGATTDHTIEGEIPFEGDDLVITSLTRGSYETKVKKCRLTPDMIDSFKDLISKYNLTEWAGRTPSAPEPFDPERTNIAALLTLRSDDGTDSLITFREAGKETGKEAFEAFRKLFFNSTGNDSVISEECLYPSLKECRGIREEHGPVTAVETYFFEMGMMYNSNKTVYQTVEKVKGKQNTVLVTVRKKAGDLPEVSDSREIESDILSRVQEISDKENLPAWEYVCKDPSIPVDRSMMPLDYSSSSSLSIYYDDSLITGAPRIKRTIGETARSMGGAAVDKEISELICKCVEQADIHVEAPTVNPFNGIGSIPAGSAPGTPLNGFMGMGMLNLNLQNTPTSTPAPEPGAPVQTGPWDCASCGQKGITGKFCHNCGAPRS